MESIIQAEGLTLMIVGMTVVFSALVILMFLMKGLKYTLNALHCRLIKHRKESGESPEDIICSNPDDVSGQLVAAIAITLILEAEQVHDDESMVITLRSIPKPYSNWWMHHHSTAN